MINFGLFSWVIYYLPVGFLSRFSEPKCYDDDFRPFRLLTLRIAEKWKKSVKLPFRLFYIAEMLSKSKVRSNQINHFIDMRPTVSESISCRKNVFVGKFRQKHVFSTWNKLTNGWSHVYKMINLVWTTFRTNFNLLIQFLWNCSKN